MLEQAMIRETPNGMVMVDGAGRVRTVNPALRRLLPVIGEPVGALAVDAIPVPELLDALDEAARTRTISERSRTVGARDLLLRGHPLADGVGCMGIVLDVTSLRLAERARRDFVANVSHELRTPVTAIVGYAETLLEDRAALPPWSVPMLEAMERNAGRLLLLVEDVLQLSKIEARGTELPLEREAILPILTAAIDGFRARARERGVTVEEDVPAALMARVNAEALEHAVGNLVDNAIKYSGSGGRVSVRAVGEGSRVRIEVADDGPGIAEEHQARIFERFYRGDPARSKAVPGTGLGLSLVKHLCLAMQAEVRFESAPRAGSRFWLLLPT
jgi:two-component system phosphate regulon sensor histidine kinase PhoR